MSQRSLRLSSEYFAEAEKKLKQKGWTRKQLADFAECSSQPVSKFFNGKSVERSIFIRICQELNLDVEQVTFTVNDEKIGSDLNASENLDIDILVQQVRQKIQPFILTQCGTMRVLDMSYPIGVDNIYTKVNILEKVTGQKRKNLSQLVEECDRHNHDRWQFSNINEPRVDGLKVVREHQQLIILGKPGAGKTTFLKHLAVKCLDWNSIFVNLVPFFVCLKDFAEADNKIGLEEYIAQQVAICGLGSSQIAYLINSGRTLILLDGLDEVRKDDIKRVIKEIQTFSYKYSHNRLVITCRIAAQEYTFEKFTEVEVADFDDEQIKSFAYRWFKDKNINLEQRFIEHLRNNPPIKELANRPILLTLLCLEFEDSGEFPNDLAELYRRAINTLLRKWDAKRGIYRDVVYKNLSTQRKEDLLSHIAKVTFEQQKYFFKQSELESYIAEYIRNLSGSIVDEEALLVDSEAVLKSIEAQHGLLVERAKGIYSFSHLTIHEYFAARAIVGTANPNLSNDLSLIYLSRKVFDKRWHEVFLLSSGMISKADWLLFLMKVAIDKTFSEDRNFQEFLSWINYKSSNVNSSSQASAVRAFYLCQAIAIYTVDNSNYPLFGSWEIGEMSELLSVLDSNLQVDVYYGNAMGSFMGNFYDWKDAEELKLDLNLAHARAQASLLARTSKMSFESCDWMEEDEKEHPGDDTNFYALTESLYWAIELSSDLELKQSLIDLEQQLPDGVFEHWDTYFDWYKNQSEAWAATLKELNQKHRQIDYDWNFDNRLWGTLRAYCYANKLLVDCLNNQSYVSQEVRKIIESSLLLPFSEVKKRLEVVKL